MDENTEKEIKEDVPKSEQPVNETEEKKETSETTNMKKEANKAKNFFIDLYKTPLDEMKKISQNSKSFLKIAIVIFITWIVAELLGSIISIVKNISNSYYTNIFMYFRNSFREFFNVFSAILGPVIIIALLSLIIYLLMKNKKKNYLTISISLVIAYLPVVTASIVSLLGYINYNVTKLTSSYSSFCSIISSILVYFAIKSLYEEDNDNKALKIFLITMAIYYGILLILKLFGLYI